jgi:hypothetical protein
MAIPAISSANPVYEQISSGVAYARTITATNTPTSYSASGLPAGLSMNTSTGAITGSPSATSATAYTASVTASNGDGTSTAQSWLIVVLPSVVGVAANGFKIPVNLDLATRKISLPGVGSPQPAQRPPGAGDASAPLGCWIEGERFTLSLGAQMAGVLQAVGMNRIKVLWRPTGSDATIELHEDESDVTATGSGTTARYEVPVYIDPAKVRGALGDGENPSGERVTGYLQIVSASSLDASDFAYSNTQTIASLTASDTEAKTFTVPLDSTSATALAYQVLLTLNNLPGAPSVTRNLTVSYGGGTYTIATNTGDTSDTGSEVGVGLFTPTLTATSVSATSTGLQIVGTVTTTVNPHTGKRIELAATYATNNDLFEITGGTDPGTGIIGGEVSGVTGTLTLAFSGSGGAIGSITIENGDTAQDLLAKIEAEISETMVAVLFPNTTTIRLIFSAATAVTNHDFGNETTLGGLDAWPESGFAPEALTITTSSITCQVIGVEMPELFQRISSQIAQHDIEMTYAV